MIRYIHVGEEVLYVRLLEMDEFSITGYESALKLQLSGKGKGSTVTMYKNHDHLTPKHIAILPL